MSSTAFATSEPWYRSLNAKQWKSLLAANLGWMFDGYETFALILSAPVAMRQLLDPSQYGQIQFYVGLIIGITLLGWGIGGLVGGVLADYIGRKRMMVYAILAYSVMTGISALSWNWESFVVLRFLCGLAVGSEWATGASMTAEVFPDKDRGKGAGLMQCGLGIGFFVASFAWLLIAGTGEHSWRWMYVIGILPALATIWIRSGIDESALREKANEQRKKAIARLQSGAPVHDAEKDLTRFTMLDLFVRPDMRRTTIIVFLMSLTTTVGWWAISTWIPPFIGSVAARSGETAATWASYAGMAYTIGSVTGYVSFGFLADAFGRKPVTVVFMLVALFVTPVMFLTSTNLTVLLLLAFVTAIFNNGQYTWMPSWLPELYPTRMRATAMAFAFNAPRFVAFLGPIVAGTLIQTFGGFGYAATAMGAVYLIGLTAVWFLPETNGKPLPL